MTMGIFLIILSIVFLLSVTLGFIYNDEKVTEVCFEIVKGSVVALFTICVCGIIKINTPQAIDVYRGRTTLEITYRDSIPIDSAVIFKE